MSSQRLLPAGRLALKFLVGVQVDRRIILAIVVFFAFNATRQLRAQAPASATQEASLTVFGGATGTYTDLSSGENVGATAGVDVELHHSNFLLPYLEVRGTYPFYQGNSDSIRDILGGLRFTRARNRYLPYFDALYGRAELHYGDGGYPNPSYTYLYKKSPSNMLSLGGGAEFPLTYTWWIKADAQWLYYSSPVASSGHLNAVPVTIGIVYRFHPP
jgi:hypothetical protein